MDRHNPQGLKQGGVNTMRSSLAAVLQSTGLRTRLLTLIVAAGLVPLLLLTVLLDRERDRALQEAQRELKSRALGQANDLENRLAGTVQLLYGLSQIPLVREGTVEACSELLAAVLAEHPQFTGLLTVTRDGALRCDSLRSGRKLDVSDRRYFKEVRARGRFAIEPAVGRLTGKAVIQIAQPFRASNLDPSFLLLASLDLDRATLAQRQDFEAQQISALLWSAGSPQAFALRGSGVKAIGRPADLTAPAPDADEPGDLAGMACAHARIDPAVAPDLRVSVCREQAQIVGVVNARYQRLLFTAGAVCAMLLLAAYLLAEWTIRRPYKHFMRAIDRVAEGELQQPVVEGSPSGEVGHMLSALERLRQSLQRQQQRIEEDQRTLKLQADTDALTGLPNRHLLADRLSQAVLHARRHGRIMALLMLDLDRFKTINDSLGHGAGDEVLKEVGRRLLTCLREADTVARVGGDEFVVLLSDVGSEQDVVHVAHKLVESMRSPVLVQGQGLLVGLCVGVALFPRDAEASDELLQRADTAMYRQKRSGGNGVSTYTPAMLDLVRRRLDMEQALRLALQQQGLQVYYQPIVDLASGEVVAAEALARWPREDAAWTSPAEFIPLAEETGLILPLGRWVLAQACAQAVLWQRAGKGIPIAVNVSAHQLGREEAVQEVLDALQDSGCPPELLQIEVTESAVMADPEHARRVLEALHSRGVLTALDDFGTGHSSLSQLRALPVRKIKIDQSFVRDLVAQDPVDRQFVDLIIGLADKLGLPCVAEGIETEGQAEMLRAMGCIQGQGYWFGRPAPGDAMR
jgi:diguanylate cyclase (GGDEF)-like protein